MQERHRLEDFRHKSDHLFILLTQNQPGRRGQTSGTNAEKIKSKDAKSGEERSGEIIR